MYVYVGTYAGTYSQV